MSEITFLVNNPRTRVIIMNHDDNFHSNCEFQFTSVKDNTESSSKEYYSHYFEIKTIFTLRIVLLVFEY